MRSEVVHAGRQARCARPRHGLGVRAEYVDPIYDGQGVLQHAGIGLGRRRELTKIGAGRRQVEAIGAWWSTLRTLGMSFRRQSRWDSDMGDVADMFRNAPAASSRSKAAPSTMYGASTAAIENTRKAGLMTEPQNFRCSCAPSAGRWWWKRRTGATDLWPGATDIWPGGDLPAGFI